MKEFCTNCQKEVSIETIVRTETYPVKGNPIAINAKVGVCADCGQDVWITENENQNLTLAYNAYRRQLGLMLPDEIRKIREKYGISQVTFAKILGLGEKTIARYENGSIQDEAQNNLILLARNPDNFMELFRKNKHKLSEDEISKLKPAYYIKSLREPLKYNMNFKKAQYDYNMPQNDGTIIDFPLKKEETA